MIRFLETLNSSFTYKEILEKSDLVSSENEYIVPGREAEYRKLNRFIKNNRGNGDALYICGQPGTGKSLTLMTLSKTLNRQVYKTVYINCYTYEKNIYSEIYKGIKNLVSTKKNEKQSYDLIKNLLPTFERTIVLILDEVDIIVKSPTVLNSIFELPFQKDSKLLLFGIANDLNLVEKSLPGLLKKGIEVSVLQFKPYKQDQVLNILNARLQDAYNKLNLTERQRSRIFEEESLELISKHISENNSDIRKAFEVMRSLFTKKYEGYIDTLNDDQLDEDADQEIPIPDSFINQDDTDNNQDQYIFTIDNVMDTISLMFESQIVKTIKHFPAHSQIILFSAFLKELNFLTLYESYKSNCELLNYTALEKKDFSVSLDCVTSNGLMTMHEGKNETNRVITIGYSKEDLVRAFRNSIVYAELLSNLVPEESESEDDEEMDE